MQSRLILTPGQRIKLQHTIEKYGLTESAFEFRIGQLEIFITHTESSYHFAFGTYPAATASVQNATMHFPPSFQLEFTPYRLNPQAGVTNPSVYGVNSWDKAVEHLNSWLALIKEEYGPFETPVLTAKSKVNSTSALDLTLLHPTIQQVAGSLFASTHYPQALLAACTALDKAVQVKAQLPASTVGTALMTTAFSAKTPLIQLSQDTNEQLGFMNLYQGSVQAIRNHYAHNLTEIPKHRAFEWLNFISALFYKLDETLPTTSLLAP